jgi:tyrosine-protein kinase Etk/Wzc
MDETLDQNPDTSKAAHRISTGTFSPREFLVRYLRYIPWLIASIILFIALAYLKLRYSPVIYQVQSKILIKKESKSAGQDKLADLFLTGESQNLNDEVQILKSTGISKRIIKNLGLQVSYISEGNLKSYTLHPMDSPLWLDIVNLKDSMQYVGFKVTIIDQNTINLGESKEPVYFGQAFETSQGKFRFIRRPVDYQQYGSNIFTIVYNPLQELANAIAAGIQVSPVNDYSNVLQVVYETENRRLGLNIVDQLMKEYNISNVEDKRTITVNTMEFIDERLDTIQKELSYVEQSLQTFKEQNKAVDIEQQATISFTELSGVNQTLTKQEVDLKIVDWLSQYLSDEKNNTKTVPTALGITEPSLQVLIAEYNQSQLRRETQIKTTTAANPIIRELDAESDKLREQIKENLSNIRQSYLINRENLLQKTRRAEAEISGVPGKGRRMLEITRSQKILEDLYSFLLQKRLETSISSASTISNSKILEPAQSSGEPVRPDKKGLYLIAVLLGIALPVAVLVIREYLNDKITGRGDIERLTTAPILGEIGHSDTTETLVVTKNARKFISEQFRIIRTNLQFILNKVQNPVILITSSFSGEGKSFVSTNIGAVLALTGKKTVILEFDIRKPKIIAGLDLAKNEGITNFIVGNVTIEEIIVPVKQVENLYVIPCGPIPPNPAELLLDEKVAELFVYLRANFDMVIIDSAPVGLVSDAVVLSAFADATLYIMRQNYTLKKQLNLINEYYLNKKLPKMSLLLNDVNVTSGYGGYYGNYGYGYSYGNGGYFEAEQRKKKGRFSSVKGIFKRK